MSGRVSDEQLAADRDYYARPVDGLLGLLDAERERLVSALGELQEAREALRKAREEIDWYLRSDTPSRTPLHDLLGLIDRALGGGS